MHMAGCTQDSAPEGTQMSNNRSNDLQFLSAPPESVPSVWANEELLIPAQYEWLTPSGKLQNVIDNPSEVSIVAIHINDSPLTIRFSSPVVPSALVVGLYSQLDELGYPVTESGVNVDCFESNRCSTVRGKSGFQFTIDSIGEAKVAVIRTAYLHPLTQDGITEDHRLSTASWVIRFVS